MTFISHNNANNHLLVVLPHLVHLVTHHFVVPQPLFFAIRGARAPVPCPNALHIILQGTARSKFIVLLDTDTQSLTDL